MTAEQEERLVKSFERIATVFETAVAKQWPTPKEKKTAELVRPEQERKEAIGDRAPEEWFDETEAAIPGGEANRSRFQERFEADQKKGK